MLCLIFHPGAAQVDRVYLALADHYERFGPSPPLPAYLYTEPYASRVVVSVGPDRGSATKYLGSHSVIAADAATLPGGAWVLFCDDDQARPPSVPPPCSSLAKCGPAARVGIHQM